MRLSASLLAVLLALLLALGAGASFAQECPGKAVRLIVPFPPGGPTDVAARLLADEMRAAGGTAFTVENRSGAAGALGIDQVAKSAPDGCTLGISGVGPTILLAALDPKLPYKPLTDLAFIGHSGFSELILVGRRGLPAKNAAELLAHARRNPGRLSYASSGSGGPVHVAFELLKSMAGIFVVHIPYRGDAASLNDLLGGQVDLAMLSSAVALPHIQAARIQPLAAAGAARSRLLPELPTLAEAGLAGYEAGVWSLLVAPAGTPAPLLARYNEALTKALRSPAVAERYAALGMAVSPMSPGEARAFVQRETEKWQRVIREAKVTRD